MLITSINGPEENEKGAKGLTTGSKILVGKVRGVSLFKDAVYV